MALVLGELATIIRADDRPMEQGLDKAKGKFGKFGLALAGAAAAIGVAAAAALGTALAGAMETETAQDKFAAQMGATPEMSRKLGAAAGELYSDAYGESLGGVNEALRSVIQSGAVMQGASKEQLKEVTAKVLDLASAFELDVGQASRAVGKMIKTGLAKDAAEALDILTRGFQTGGDEAGDLLDTVSEYSTKFRDLGLSGQQAMGLLSQGLKGGARDADTVADALKELAIRSIDGSATTAAGYRALGLDADKMAAQIAKGGDGAAKGLDTILDRLRGMKDPVAQDAAAVALFGTKAEDLGDALYSLDPSAAVASLGEVAGAADRMGDTLNDNAGTKLEAFKRKAETKLNELGAGIISMFENVANRPAVKEFLADTKKFIDEDILPALRRLWSWIDKHIMPVLEQLADQYLQQAKDALDELRQAVADNQPELEKLAGWLETAAKFVLEKVVPVIGPLFTGTLGNVIRMVKATVVQIAFFVRVISGIKDAVTGAVTWVKSKFGDMVKFVKDLPGKIKKAAAGMWNGIKDAFRGALNWIIDKWNGLSFTLPSITVFGQTIGGATLSTPNIPNLAAGGLVPATPAGRIVRVAEAGEDEAIAPLSRLLPMIRDAVSGAGSTITVVIRDEMRNTRQVVRAQGGDTKTVFASSAISL